MGDVLAMIMYSLSFNVLNVIAFEVVVFVEKFTFFKIPLKNFIGNL